MPLSRRILSAPTGLLREAFGTCAQNAQETPAFQAEEISAGTRSFQSGCIESQVQARVSSCIDPLSLTCGTWQKAVERHYGHVHQTGFTVLRLTECVLLTLAELPCRSRGDLSPGSSSQKWLSVRFLLFLKYRAGTGFAHCGNLITDCSCQMRTTPQQTRIPKYSVDQAAVNYCLNHLLSCNEPMNHHPSTNYKQLAFAPLGVRNHLRIFQG